MSIVISVENLSKVYRLGQIGTGTFSHDLNVWWARMRGQPNPMQKIGAGDHGNRDGDELWALRDVSFTVEQGEVLGIIGRNGAGKSTLLKILSRVTAPTSGKIKVNGRIASLLEVGTGFHPDLTGRENIFLNGAILGMNRREIERKFDEIVDFAEIEKFIDTPVKRYSSGMYVRLAFAVAAHLEPEILVVDEVLAVGDAEFQKKCLGKMGDVAKEGRTVLFVSHNMPMIRQLCGKAILLNKGKLTARGTTEEVITTYLDTGTGLQEHASEIRDWISRFPDDPVFKLMDVHIFQDGNESNFVGNGSPVEIIIEYIVREEVRGLRVFFDLLDQGETILFRSFHDNSVEKAQVFTPGRYSSRAVIPADWLSPTTYRVQIHAAIHDVRMVMPSEIRIPLFVQNTGIVNRAYIGDPIRGKLSPTLRWETTRVENRHHEIS